MAAIGAKAILCLLNILTSCMDTGFNALSNAVKLILGLHLAIAQWKCGRSSLKVYGLDWDVFVAVSFLEF